MWNVLILFFREWQEYNKRSNYEDSTFYINRHRGTGHDQVRFLNIQFTLGPYMVVYLLDTESIRSTLARACLLEATHGTQKYVLPHTHAHAHRKARTKASQPGTWTRHSRYNLSTKIHGSSLILVLLLVSCFLPWVLSTTK